MKVLNPPRPLGRRHSANDTSCEAIVSINKVCERIKIMLHAMLDMRPCQLLANCCHRKPWDTPREACNTQLFHAETHFAALFSFSDWVTVIPVELSDLCDSLDWLEQSFHNHGGKNQEEKLDVLAYYASQAQVMAILGYCFFYKHRISLFELLNFL